MAHFVAFVAEKRNRKVQMDVHASSVDIGTRSSCALTVRDNVAAERHCEIRFDESRAAFFVRDLGSSTGTYINGVRVTDPIVIKEGDGIVLGTLRLSVSMGFEDDPKALALEVHERGFHFQKSALVRKTGDWIRGDREEWKESEVSFGRFPALRVAVWSALLLAVLLPFVLLNESVRATSLSPGPLTFSHAALFAANADLLPQQAAQVARGCNACHETGNGIPLENCLGCHASSGFGHPFAPGADSSEPAVNLCISCHVEHRGDGQRTFEEVQLTGAWSGMTVSLPKRSAGFVPETDDALCARCHEEESFDQEKLGVMLAAYSEHLPPTRTVRVAFDGFSHEQHLRSGLDCKTCHLPDFEGLGAAGSRDFKPLAFEGCMACHGADDLAPGLQADLPGIAADLSAPAFPVRWHGAKDSTSACESCHESTYSAPLRTVERESFTYLSETGEALPRADGDPKQLFGYSLRSHRQQFERAIADLKVPAGHPDNDCRSCHQDGTWLGTGQDREGRFYHGLHLFEDDLLLASEVQSLAQNAAGRNRLAQAAKSCDECHSGVIDADDLVLPFYRAETHACIACHQTEEGDDSAVPSLITDPNRLQRGPATAQVAFPHAAHGNTAHPKLAAGCYACHEFQVASEAFRNPITTRASIKDCTECHDSSHSNIAGGSCGTCHTLADPAFAAEFTSDEWSLRKQWPAATNFSHFSSGHLSEVETSCQLCHLGTETATNIMDVPIPTETDAACRTCHVEERARFHWR